MALFVPVIIGLPIGYFTWAKVFDTVDDCVSQALSGNNKTTEKGPNSSVAATVGTIGSVGILSKLMFKPNTRHRLFFAQAPANSNIRIETLKMGIELLVRTGIVFYGGAVVGASAGRVMSIKKAI
ncbi:hypothetical protein BDF21DRAFT_236627 [Thamnidium elegans]|uniref:Uncharacterized protein n=1 Tax=Thamnidium elegans TaxID=101142 RepID=A0A8H7SJ26_9FUNG|nr:hypothetical protein INT48_000973 [Thamnidium elegans]KAI8085392.1 hypothetical protein BDF21DRAFT_236627 [Thamnidium elegans]